MTYVDLNPVHAVMAATPEQSGHNSIQLRSQTLNQKPGQKDWVQLRLVPMVAAVRIGKDDRAHFTGFA